MAHDPSIKRTHYYHADANALGGLIEQPFEQIIPVQAPLSLAPVGGYASSQTAAFHLQGVLSFKAAHTQVAGRTSKSGTFSTLVTSVVEGVNVLNILTADRLVAQISLDHPQEGYVPKVNFVGTQFENVRIGGKPVEIVVDLDICNQGDGVAFPGAPCARDNGFLLRVGEQRQRMTSPTQLGKDAPVVPEWVKERYRWKDSDAKGAKDSVVCSIVKEIRGDFPGTRCGHVFDIPEFGKGFLGEVLVDSGSLFQLIMLRVELGCATHGQATFAAAKGNGSTDP